MNLFDWNDGVFSIEDKGGFKLHISSNESFRIGTAGACIANRDGKLSLMTNNCHIVGSDTDTIPNGSNVSPSGDFAAWCSEAGMQAGAHNTAFLPNRHNDSITYLVHRMRDSYWPAGAMSYVITADTLYLSTIIQQEDGSYEVSEKNRKILEHSAVNGRVIGIPTEDEQGWWVFTQEAETNTFLFQRINSDGTVSEPVISATGPINTWANNGDNAVNISNDGGTLALSSEEFGTLLYDFDRQTGKITYDFHLPPEDDTGNSWSDGYVWSPTNRFLYVADGWTIIQYDLESNAENFDSIHLVNTQGMSDSTGWVVSLGSGYLGPDCRIYFSSGATAQSFHVIHYPDRKGHACTVQSNIPLPNNMAWNFPMITKFRMGSSEEEVCDSSIDWFGVIPSSVEEANLMSQTLQVYPNPSSGQIMVGLQGLSSFDQLAVYDIIGRQVLSLKDWDGQGYIDLIHLESGVYIVEAVRDNVIYTESIVLE